MIPASGNRINEELAMLILKNYSIRYKNIEHCIRGDSMPDLCDFENLFAVEVTTNLPEKDWKELSRKKKQSTFNCNYTSYSIDNTTSIIDKKLIKKYNGWETLDLFIFICEISIDNFVDEIYQYMKKKQQTTPIKYQNLLLFSKVCKKLWVRGDITDTHSFSSDDWAKIWDPIQKKNSFPKKH